jgi:tetrapyrrole methylase family protein / MazG family protein
MSNEQCGAAFTKILDTLDTLHGPNGCPWDRKQTFQSLRTSLLEEAHEVLEALDQEDIHNLREELGDLLFNVLFLGKIAQKEAHFTIEEMLLEFNEKLIRRHPHVFGEISVDSIEQVKQVWEQVKQEEKGHRKTPFEGIPKGMPALAKAVKMAKHFEIREEKSLFKGKEELAELLWQTAQEAYKQGLDAESILRERLSTLEREYSAKDCIE